MKVIGLTGGVGSGKSTVALQMEKLWKVELLITDEMGHEAFLPGSETLEQVLAVFGKGILDERGEVSRKALAAEIFADDTKREKLNGIVHPFVMAKIKKAIEEKKNQEGILVLESAILVESGCLPLCDEVWYVSLPEESRKKRLKESRNYSDAKIDAIMKKQLPEEEFLKIAHRVIDNSGTLETVVKQLKEAERDLPVTENPA